MQDQDAKFWRVRSSAGDTIGLNFKGVTATTSASEAYTALETFINDLTGDWVDVRVYTKAPNVGEDGKTVPGKQTGQYTFGPYRVALNSAGINGTGGGGGGRDSNVQVLVELAVLRKEMELQKEIDKLERELEEKNKGSIDGFNMQKEMWGMAKEWLTAKKVETDMVNAANKSKGTTDAPAAAIAEKVEPGVVATSIGNIKAVMNGQTMELIEAIGIYAKVDPDNFKTMATSVLNGVTAYKETMAKTDQ